MSILTIYYDNNQKQEYQINSEETQQIFDQYNEADYKPIKTLKFGNIEIPLQDVIGIEVSETKQN